MFVLPTGVRYAEPPINDLRFRKPKPLPGWNGLVDATEPGRICPQVVNGSKSTSSWVLQNKYESPTSNNIHSLYVVMMPSHNHYVSTSLS